MYVCEIVTRTSALIEITLYIAERCLSSHGTKLLVNSSCGVFTTADRCDAFAICSCNYKNSTICFHRVADAKYCDCAVFKNKTFKNSNGGPHDVENQINIHNANVQYKCTKAATYKQY